MPRPQRKWARLMTATALKPAWAAMPGPSRPVRQASTPRITPKRARPPNWTASKWASAKARADTTMAAGTGSRPSRPRSTRPRKNSSSTTGAPAARARSSTVTSNGPWAAPVSWWAGEDLLDRPVHGRDQQVLAEDADRAAGDHVERRGEAQTEVPPEPPGAVLAGGHRCRREQPDPEAGHVGDGDGHREGRRRAGLVADGLGRERRGDDGQKQADREAHHGLGQAPVVGGGARRRRLRPPFRPPARGRPVGQETSEAGGSDRPARRSISDQPIGGWVRPACASHRPHWAPAAGDG